MIQRIDAVESSVAVISLELADVVTRA